MKLFRNKETEKACCCKESSVKEVKQNFDNGNGEVGIKILGSGCKKCNELEKNVKTAITELKLDLKIEHITDFAQIASYGVMTTPAIVFNGKVVSYGKVLSVDEVKNILK